MNDSTALTTTNHPGEMITTADAITAITARFSAHLAAEVGAGQLARDTADAYVNGATRFTRWALGAGVPLTTESVKAWLIAARQEAAPASVSVWFGGLRAFCRWALGAGLLTIDPTEGIKRGRRIGTSATHKRDILTDDEMKRVLSLPLSPRDRAIIYLLAYTGARGIELHRADVGDLGTEGGEMILRVHGKGRVEADERVVIASPVARDSVYAYLADRKASSGPLFVSASNRSAGKRLSRRGLRAIVRGILDAAGIVDRRKSTHSFRHTAITSAIRHGAGLLDVQAMARHASPNTTMIYVRNLNRIQNAAERLIEY